MMINFEKIRDDAKWMRNRLLDLALNAGSAGSHLGGALSTVEIFSVLFAIIEKEGKLIDRDRVILSKGHAAMALYCALERHGLLSSEEVDTFETNGTKYFAHASRDVQKGIDFSGGSLGLGVSYGVGIAMANKFRGLDRHVYIIVGDGECNEGIVWEALMTIKNQHLNNITIIVDCNGFQADGATYDVLDMSPLEDKFKSFGMDVSDIDGHSIESLVSVLQEKKGNCCRVILAHTIKGKGISFIENNTSWHHNVLSPKKYDLAKKELNGNSHE